MFSDDDLLPLSGLQHMEFCERQWALIHIEQVWAENRLTAEGRVLHERVHDSEAEGRPDVVICRGLPLRSSRLGLSGQADVVEFERASQENPGAVAMPGRSGYWRPFPVEYKRGRPKHGACDEVQLCAQALCLEEALGVSIRDGALFYGTPRRRHAVQFSEGLRAKTEALSARMHDLFRSGVTPSPIYGKKCESCSLRELCMPKALAGGESVEQYLRRALSRS